MAFFKFGGGRVGEVRYVADPKVGIAGRRGAFAAYAMEADIPASLRKGALEAVGGRSDSARDARAIRNHGVDIHQRVGEMGLCVLNVVAFG